MSSFGSGYFIPKYFSYSLRNFLVKSSESLPLFLLPFVVTILILIFRNFPCKYSNSPTPRYKRYVDITGVRPNLYRIFEPTIFLDATGMFEIASKCLSTKRDTSNVALTAGSSQQGNALLASAASNCVVARYFVFPFLSLYWLL